MTVPENFWESAIRRHDRQVFLSLLAIGLSPDDARDIAQATWTQLLEKSAAGQLASIELPGLAIRQARFLALNSLRAAKTEERALKLVDISERGSDLEQEIISRTELDAALTELAKASTLAKKIFRLAYGVPPHAHAEIAREVGLSLQRVRQILCETRRQLRNAINEGELR